MRALAAKRLLKSRASISQIFLNYSTPSSSTGKLLQEKIQVGDVQINYGKIGNGSQPVVFLPGIFGQYSLAFTFKGAIQIFLNFIGSGAKSEAL